jgi:hypothetical protein
VSGVWESGITGNVAVGCKAIHSGNMNPPGTRRTAVQAGMTFVAFLSALPILADIVGTAAWNSVNFAVAVYLALAFFGTIGLLTGTVTGFFKKPIFAWMTGLSAAAIFCLSLLFLLSFLFSRTEGVPLSDPLIFGSIQTPIIVFYGFAMLCCSVVGVFSLKKIRSKSAP